jgi:hypothetical protein
MPNIAKLGKRERPPKRTRKMVENFRATLTWVDVLIGTGSCLGISLLLIGFRFQSIPEFKVGEIAN